MSSNSLDNNIQVVQTQAFNDQNPGTSGLRKKVKVFEQPNYTENFIQATLNTLFTTLKNSSNNTKQNNQVELIVGGDGRYYSPEVIDKIIRISAANQIRKLYIAQDGILSTPAASNLIRKLKLDGGILLTASHNPGGPENDFGIKFNTSNGGPAPQSFTNLIYENAKTMESYKIINSNDNQVDISKIASFKYMDIMQIEIIDPINDYVLLLKDIFDFKLIKSFIHSNRQQTDTERGNNDKFTILFDGMNGVTGPYAKRIFIDELGLDETSVMNCEPKPDFGGGHPDPNLTYASELVDRVAKDKIQFGAASDGDGDRNMIISHDAFVNPSDSVAIIAANYHRIPYFKKNKLTGVARSMPTSTALDKVANKLGLEMFETPTGWKFFGNLMDSNRIQICGEESFGTGSDHIREKDGLWAIMAWLNILAHAQNTHKEQKVTIDSVLGEHYKLFGRNYFSRYDYEEVDAKKASSMIQSIQEMIENNELVGKVFGDSKQFKVKKADNFAYTDPIDNSVSKNQGLRIVFECGSRLIYRLSGTGSQGATIRIYIEKYEEDYAKIQEAPEANQALDSLIKVGLNEIAKIKEFIGTDKPTVIT